MSIAIERAWPAMSFRASGAADLMHFANGHGGIPGTGF